MSMERASQPGPGTTVSEGPAGRRVLLTGATGFIGRPCLELLLDRGWEVHAASSRPAISEHGGARWHQADLLDPVQASELVARAQPRFLLHVAWYMNPTDFYHSVQNFRWVQASLGLLQEFIKHGGQRVVMTGSSAEYDWSYGHCSEASTPLAPRTVYGVCKRALSDLFSAFAESQGVSGAWARVFFTYGPREHPDRLVSSVIRSILAGRPARCTHGNQIRDYLYVEDVADALVTLLGSDITGPVNVASGRPTRLKELIYTAAQKLGGEDQVELGAIPAPSDDPPLVVADVPRLSDRVGWQPRFDLDRGLEATIAWWQAELSARVAEEA